MHCIARTFFVHEGTKRLILYPPDESSAAKFTAFVPGLEPPTADASQSRKPSNLIILRLHGSHICTALDQINHDATMAIRPGAVEGYPAVVDRSIRMRTGLNRLKHDATSGVPDISSNA